MNEEKIKALKEDIVSMSELKHQEKVRELLDDLEEEVKTGCEVRLLRNNFNKRRIDHNESEEEE